MYWSSYDGGRLDSVAGEALRHHERATVGCVFDDTAAGCTTSDALKVAATLRGARAR